MKFLAWGGLTALVAASSWAQPTGGQIVAGSATIASAANTTTITQSSARAIITWQDFSSAAGDVVRFVQPDAASATLNRVISATPSSLAGALEANGRIFLINPHGILIGSGARIDTAGFLASTLDVTDREFLAGGDLHFSGASPAAVVNLGAIDAAHGDVFLIARQVENTGAITAANGTAGLAAGSEVLLTTGGDERLFVHAASSPGTVINSGALHAAAAELKAAGGNAYALAINNTGLVRATGDAVRDGQIWLVGSNESLVANSGTLDASSAKGQGGRIVATGGRVLLDDTARLDATGATGGGEIKIGGGWHGEDPAVGNASAVIIRAGATLDASATKAGDGGTVVLWSQDYTNFLGRIAATGGPLGGQGGSVETSSHGNLQATGLVNTGGTGHWLLDPWNVTIADSGASGTTFADNFDPAADSVILASSINASLDNGTDVTITTGTTGSSGGSINVNAPLTWSANSTLTLSAYIDVRVNQPITATGDTAGLVITPNNPSNSYGGTFSLNNRASITLSGATPSLTISGQSYTVINSLGAEGDAISAPATPTLQGLAATANLGGRYALGSNLDASDTANWNVDNSTPAGFTPIGTSAQPFTGTFEGLGHTITGLSITRPSTNNVGLFGYINITARIRRTGLLDAFVVGNTSVGGLVGYNSYGGVSQSYVSGTVGGSGHFSVAHKVGGLVGTNDHGSLSAAYSLANVNGIDDVGGLVGFNDTGSIEESYATGNVSGQTNVGGLVGASDAYSDAESVGTIKYVYATGDVSGSENVGGLVGSNTDTGLTEGYATGSVSGTTNVGGLAGSNEQTKPEITSESIGIYSSYWNTETTGQTGAVGLENGQTQYSSGLTTAQTMQKDSFAAFLNITSVGGDNNYRWRIYEGHTTPWLMVFLYPTTITANNDSKTYDSTAYSGNNGVTHSLSNPNPAYSGTLAYGGTAAGATNAGSYTLIPSGLYSIQQGYNIAFANGTLTIGKANLTLSGTRAYDGTTAFAGGNLTANGVNGESFAVTGTGAAGNLATKNVQTSQLLASVTGLALGASGNGGLAGNYNALSTANSSVSVTPLALTVAGFAAEDKVYDGTTDAVITTPGTLSGVVLGDTVGFTQTGATFDTKNTGTGKTVTLNGVTLTGSGDETNYSYTATTTELSDITAAMLTYTADLASRTYGATNPTFTGTITGFVPGDTQLNATTGTAAFVTTATATSNVGSYAINGSGLTANNGNYVFAQAAGNATALTISPADLTVTGTRVFDGTTLFAGTNLTATGANGETFSITGAGASGNLSTKNVQTNQPLASLTGLALGTSSNGGLAGNYNALSAPHSSVSVTPASVTASTSDVVKTYDGNTIAAGTPVLSSGTLFGTDALTGGSFAFANKNVGSGDKTVTVTGITVNDGNGGSNYTVTQANNTTSTINAATLTYVANPASRYVGASDPAFSGTVTGFKGGETQGTATTGTLAFNTTATNASPVGNYPIDGSGLTANNGNYVFVQAAGNATAFTIESLPLTPLTITADNKTKLYGDALPDFTATFAGFINGDDASSVTGLQFSTTATASSNVGTFTITPFGATAPSSYSVTYVPGTLTINPATLTYTATPTSRFVGAVDPAFGGTVTGFVNGDAQATATTGTATFATTAVSTSPVGVYPVNGSGLTANHGNYVFVQAASNATAFTIAEHTPLTITAEDKTKIYGGALPVFTASFAGFVNGDTAASVTGLQFSTTATIGSNVGTYVITPFGATAPTYYTIDYVAGTLTISPAALSITAGDVSRLYGATNPVFTASFAGLVNGDTAAVVTGLQLTTAATTASGVGHYAITPSGAAAANYVLTFVPGTLTISPAQLTIAANSISRLFGADTPAFSADISGFVNGDTSSVVTGLGFSTTPTNVPDDFTIVPGGATANNYTINYLNGLLHIVVPTVPVGGDEAPVTFIDGAPVQTDEFAVVEQDGQRTLVSISPTNTAPPPDEQLRVTLDQNSDLPALENGTPAQSLTLGRTSTELNFGNFEPAGGAASGGGANDPGLFRETSVSQGGFNIIYHEAISDEHEQSLDNAALGSSYREFSDSDNPQINLVRSKVERKPGESSSGASVGGGL